MNYKIFCDESNHLLNDKSNVMVNGAICVPEEEVIDINKYIKHLKHKHNYYNELKWTKLIKSQRDFYIELIDYFFQSNMRFKATFIPNKKEEVHKSYGRTHDEFYYIVYYYTIRNFIENGNDYKIYLDYKDINGGKRSKKLEEKLKLTAREKSGVFIIQSQESQVLQLCDLFIGAIAYKNRTDIVHKSEIKNFIIEYLESKLSYELIETAPWVEKFNIFRWFLSGRK